jgi:flagellar biosynthesis chaperone FliJ
MHSVGRYGQWLIIGAFAVLAVPPAVADNGPAPGWKFEKLHLKSGVCFQGLLVEETASGVRFQNVRQAPGRPTVIIETIFPRNEVAGIDRLADADRERLQARIRELEQSSGTGEKERLPGLELETVAWGKDPKGGLRYTSDYFMFTSNAPEEVVRRAAYRLEQIYLAYTRFLPPRHPGGEPTRVELLIDADEYQRLLLAQKQPFLNPAFFDGSANRIVCFSDLQRLGEELAQVQKAHDKLRQELNKQDSELRKLYKSKELERMLEPIKQTRARIAGADNTNKALFDRVTHQLFATLYHEAFHAYLNSFVYPPRSGELPRWLNEGLAQIFETAVVEAGELRVGHAEYTRLMRAKDALRKGELVPLEQLLNSGPKQFMLVHVGERQISDQHYLTSWAVAFYLTFDRRLFGSEAMDQYVRRLAEKADAREAFEALTGQKLPQFEKDFARYLQDLQPDGSMAKLSKP